MLKPKGRRVLQSVDARKEQMLSRRLLLMASLTLYGHDNLLRSYNSYRYRPTSFISRETPIPNAYQETITALLGEDTRSRLYIGTHSGPTPSHYLSIEKNAATGLWAVTDARLRTKLGRGVCFWWRSGFQEPENCHGLIAQVFLIDKGKSQAQAMLDALATRPTAHLELSHAAIICKFFGVHGGIHLRSLKGKAIFEIDEDPALDGIVRPFRFVPIKVATRSGYDRHARVQIWGNADRGVLLDQGIRTAIIPQVRNAEPGPVPYGVDALLIGQVCPLIGVSLDGISVSYYTLHYDPRSTSGTTTACVAAGDTLVQAAGVPTLIAREFDHEAGFNSIVSLWSGNDAMIVMLAMFLDATNIHTPDKLRAVWSALAAMGLTSREEAEKFFEISSYPLTSSEIAWKLIYPQADTKRQEEI